MNEIQNKNFTVRTINENGEIWIVAKDVANALDYAETSNPVQIFAHVPEVWKGMKRIHTLGGEQDMLCLAEQGLYVFLSRSDNPQFSAFQDWIIEEIKRRKSLGELQVFSYKGKAVRTVEIDGDVWFVAKDVCDILEIKNHRDAIRVLDEDEKRVSEIPTPSNGGYSSMNIISESGLYTIMMRSNKPESKPFRRWVTHDVLPSIRKTGSYSVNRPSYMIEDSIERAKAWIKEEEERRELSAENRQLVGVIALKDTQILEMQPKASYYDVVLACKDLLPITVIAKDYGWSAKRMNEWLHNQDIQYRCNETWLLYQKYAEQGYTRTKTHVYSDEKGMKHTKVHTYWTQKGRLFLYEIMKANGNLPLIEKTV